MAIKQEIKNCDGIYFITITCCDWLPLFEIAQSYPAVYNWFQYLKNKGHFISGYVIMPNHLHALIAFSNHGENINRIIGNGKRFMAYYIIDKLKENGNEKLLHQLSAKVNSSDKKRGKLHEVFTPSFDIKECFTQKFIQQKLDYIHSNPCTGKWNLAPTTDDYAHSSSRYYSEGIQGIFLVDSIMEVLNIDLSKKN
jgi:REP element-mobilizing transposase RayT